MKNKTELIFFQKRIYIVEFGVKMELLEAAKLNKKSKVDLSVIFYILISFLKNRNSKSTYQLFSYAHFFEVSWFLIGIIQSLFIYHLWLFPHCMRYVVNGILNIAKSLLEFNYKSDYTPRDLLKSKNETFQPQIDLIQCSLEFQGFIIQYQLQRRANNELNFLILNIRCPISQNYPQWSIS